MSRYRCVAIVCLAITFAGGLYACSPSGGDYTGNGKTTSSATAEAGGNYAGNGRGTADPLKSSGGNYAGNGRTAGSGGQ